MPVDQQVVASGEEQELHTKIVAGNKIKGRKVTTGPHKVLIVEDNPGMCGFYNHIFSSLYACTFAFNGLEALALLKKFSFDLVLSDIMMPEMDGFELKEK
ncbi:unnamed protein product, partial [Cyprideis torosa]